MKLDCKISQIKSKVKTGILFEHSELVLHINYLILANQKHNNQHLFLRINPLRFLEFFYLQKNQK